MKRAIPLILSFAILFTFLSSNIFAGQFIDYDDFVQEGIINSLRYIESEKDDYGLADVDFTELTYSEPIRTYEYTSEGAAYNDFRIVLSTGGVIYIGFDASYCDDIFINGNPYKCDRETLEKLESMLKE